MAAVPLQLSLAASKLAGRKSSTVFHCMSLFSTDSAAMGSKQATTIKKLHKANKEMFGELLETKQEKMKTTKAVTKQKKAEAKKKAKALIMSASSDLQLDDDLDPPNLAPAKTDTKPGFVNTIKEKYTVDHDVISAFGPKDDLKAEMSWTMKNLPERAKIISRFNPQVPGKTLELLKKSDGQDQLSAEMDPPKANTKGLTQAPTLQQLLASLEVTDLLPTSEKKFVTVPKASTSTEVPDNNQNAEIIVEDFHSVVEQEQESTIIVAPELFELAPNKTEGFLETASATGNDNFASTFDNPKRELTTVIQSSKPQLEIISYQYGYKRNVGTRLPSVSKILQATMSPEQVQILEKWQQKMILQLGEDGFKKYKDALFSNGKELHKNLQLVLSGTPREYLTIDDAIFGHWNSLQTLLPEVKEVQVLESLVAHPQLDYCGIVDCVAVYRDKLVLIDWKTSEKKKSFVSMTYDTPLQISAYIGALNHDPNYAFKVTNGLIVIAYQDGSTCQHFQLSPADLTRYWREWLRRLNLYKNIKPTSKASE